MIFWRENGSILQNLHKMRLAHNRKVRTEQKAKKRVGVKRKLKLPKKKENDPF